MPVIGQDVVIKNIVKFGGGFTRQVNKTMKEVLKVLDDKITENMSLTDHSLDDLAELDHPYARRHGSIRIHEPYFQVHRQTGLLLESKEKGTTDANVNSGTVQATAFVKLNPNVAQYARSVVYGTSKTLPRPVLQGSRDQVVPQIKQILKTNLKNAVIQTQE